jgi:hypothetical protein
MPPLEKLNEELGGQKGSLLCGHARRIADSDLGTLSLSVLHALNWSAGTPKSIELPNDGNRSKRQGW